MARAGLGRACGGIYFPRVCLVLKRLHGVMRGIWEASWGMHQQLGHGGWEEGLTGGLALVAQQRGTCRPLFWDGMDSSNT